MIFAMTDEERTELCNNLRCYEYTVYNQMAADEIEQLALAQSDAEPVAWRVKDLFNDAWILCNSLERAEREAENAYNNLIQPLYSTPPRPDTSARLIEAEKIVDDFIASTWGETKPGPYRKKMIEMVSRVRGACMGYQ